MPEDDPLSRAGDVANNEIGVAATLPASLGSSGLPGPDLPPAMPVVDEAERNRVFSALFQTPVEETRLGRYVVRGTLGRGAMGIVLEAFDPGLDRRVALKVLHRELDVRHTTRLRREAQALAKLSHPNVVQVYEVGEVEGQTFVAMEMVKGQTLREWMHQDPRPSWRSCLDVFLQVGAGLAAAHEQGLVHRDFKPANAIIDAKGRARVLDFGLARQVDGLDEEDSEGWRPSESKAKTDPELEFAPLEASLTRTGAVLGTPAYMPPEQMRGQEADGRSDQFSFCVSLYEAVYGERPFEGSTIGALMMAMAYGNIRPATKGARVPARLRSVLVRGLAAESEDRWPSMELLLDELRRVIAPRRGRWLVLGVGLLSIVGSLAGLGVLEGVRPDVGRSKHVMETPPAALVSATAGSTSGGVDRELSSGGSGSLGESRGVEVEADPIAEPEADPIVEVELPPAVIEPRKPKRKPRKTNRGLKHQFKKNLRKCGETGTIITITANLVLSSGKLHAPKSKITGPGKNDPAVKACVDSKLDKFKLLPSDQQSNFASIVVTI